jgi:hypothetical protein
LKIDDGDYDSVAHFFDVFSVVRREWRLRRGEPGWPKSYYGVLSATLREYRRFEATALTV